MSENEWGYSEKKEKKKCECGWSITSGKDDDPKKHPYYCPLSDLYVEKPVDKEEKLEPRD